MNIGIFICGLMGAAMLGFLFCFLIDYVFDINILDFLSFAAVLLFISWCLFCLGKVVIYAVGQ